MTDGVTYGASRILTEDWYDALDRVSAAHEPFALALTFTYDAVGHRKTVADSFGGLQTSTYDAVGRVLTRAQTASGGDLRTTYAYSARGEEAAVSRFSDAAGTALVGRTVNTFDGSGRLVNRQHRDAGGTAFQNTTHTYDLADRLTGTTLNGTPTHTLAYDAASQLTGDGAVAHSYDLSGSRTDAGHVVGPGNQVTSDGTWTYTYDAAGARSKKSLGASATTWTFAYDHHGHLTRVEERATDGGALVSRVDYSYDALGNRVRRVEYDGALSVVSDERFGFDGWKTGGGGFVGQENFDVWVDVDGSNALVTRRVFGDKVDSVTARINAAGVEAWYLTDRQGSVVGITNASGTPTATIAYDGFGNVTSDTGPGAGDRYRYTGREWDDPAGGILLLRDRWLAFDLGGFLSRDRMGFGAGDPNLTRYVKNSFPNASDPSGYLELFGPSSGSALGMKPPPPPTGWTVSGTWADTKMVFGYAWGNKREATEVFFGHYGNNFQKIGTEIGDIWQKAKGEVRAWIEFFGMAKATTDELVGLLGRPWDIPGVFATAGT